MLEYLKYLIIEEFLLTVICAVSFAGFLIVDLYLFPVVPEAPANGCGFLRPLK